MSPEEQAAQETEDIELFGYGGAIREPGFDYVQTPPRSRRDEHAEGCHDGQACSGCGTCSECDEPCVCECEECGGRASACGCEADTFVDSEPDVPDEEPYGDFNDAAAMMFDGEE